MAVEILQKDTYLTMIRSSLGTNLYRNLYALVGGMRADILKDGDLSCAFFVSSLLHQFSLIARPHATVAGLERDLKASGWKLAEMPVPGAVLIWESVPQTDGEVHAHSGFFIGGDVAISNSYKEKTPIEHHLTFGETAGKPARALSAIYVHDFLTR